MWKLEDIPPPSSTNVRDQIARKLPKRNKWFGKWFGKDVHWGGGNIGLWYEVTDSEITIYLRLWTSGSWPNPRPRSSTSPYLLTGRLWWMTSYADAWDNNIDTEGNNISIINFSDSDNSCCAETTWKRQSAAGSQVSQVSKITKNLTGR